MLTTDPALRLRTALNLKPGLTEQMVPLDPPFAAEATVGGVIASNSSRSFLI